MNPLLDLLAHSRASQDEMTIVALIVAGVTRRASVAQNISILKA
jgi:hypothetical protein